MKFTFLLFAFALLTSCQTQKSGLLTKLNDEQIYKRVQDGLFAPLDVAIENGDGQTISREEMNKLNRDSFYFDQYVDNTNIVRKYKIRHKIASDDSLARQIKQLFADNLEVNIKYLKHTEKDSVRLAEAIKYATFSAPAKIVPVDCNNLSVALDSILQRDQKNRASSIDPIKDKENRNLVVSVLENCAANITQNLGEQDCGTLFMVIQHSTLREMKKYYPFFEKLTLAGKLSKSTLVLMKDRILLAEGHQQKYGTQFKFNFKSKKLEVESIEDAANVDIRRKSVGLGTLEDYLNGLKSKY